MKVRTPTSGASACRGFTLLELLLVCALVLLAAGLVGSFLSGNDQKEFTRDLRQISALLNNARRLAIVTGAEQTVRLATAANEPDPSAAEPSRPPNWLNAGMRLRYAASVDDPLEEIDDLELIYFPMGSSSGGLIELEDGEREAYLYVFPLTGKLIIEPGLGAIEDQIVERQP